MNAVSPTLYTAAFTLCVVSAGLLGERRSRTGQPFVCVTGFLAVVAFGLACEVLMALPDTPLKALWLGLRMGTSLLLAPCLWLAIRELAEGVRPSWSDLTRREIVAIAAGFALTLPLIARAHFGTDFAHPERVTTVWHSRLIHGAMLGCVAIFAWQVPVYLQRCRRVLKTREETANTARDATESRSLAWLPLVMVGTTWVLGIARTVQCAAHMPPGLTYLFAATEAGVTVGAIYAMVRRITLTPGNREPRPPESEDFPDTSDAPIVAEATAPTPPEVDAPAVDPGTKYAKSRLDDATRLRIRRKLETALAHRDRYRDSLLSLRTLSHEIGEKTHTVSQVLNQELNVSFFEFVNRHRVEVAKRLLVDRPDRTVLEIALDVGFNAKSTFNTAFRRCTGMTPKAFRATHQDG